MDIALIVSIVIQVLIVVQSSYLYKYLKKLNGSVDNMQGYMNSIKMGVSFLEQMIQAQDKDPDTESNKEKMVKYVRIAVDSVDEFLKLQESEAYGPEEKNKRLKDFMVDQVRESIKIYEGEDSELLDEDKIVNMVNMLLGFVWPLVKPEAEKKGIDTRGVDVTKVDLDEFKRRKESKENKENKD